MTQLSDWTNAAQKSPRPLRLARQLTRRNEQAPAQSMARQAACRGVQTAGARLRPAELVSLQRAVGNRLVQRIGLQRGERRPESALAAGQSRAGPTSHAGAASALGTVQRMSLKERNGLNPDDYGDARFNRTLRSGYRLFTIWHNTDKNFSIQVHWHPISDDFPQEAWTVRWATEGRGNKPALEWMKEKIRATPEGTMVALASMQQGGAEYEKQFPGLGPATGSTKK